MEELFELKTRQTYDGLKETYRIYFQKIKKQSFYAEIIVGMLIIITSVIGIFTGIPIENAILLIAFGLGIFIAIFNLPKKKANEAVRLENWDMQNTYTFYQNYFLCENYNSRSRLDYERIEDVYVANNNIVILYNQQVLHLLFNFNEKDFTEGNFNDFIIFIKDKTNCKIKQ